ncbi:MAG: hypothetical protein KBG12_01200 [Syntrophobacterales bacterium]|nr:hypothetical protein [Syntrophobacterales bacterium]
MKKLLVLICLGIVVIVAGQAMAQETAEQWRPIQLSLTPDIAIFDRSTRIKGFTLGIWSENPQDAFALGIVNGSSRSSAGLSIGVANYADSYAGVQISAFNYAKENFTGWGVGVANVAKGAMKGLQTGAVNYAGNLSGLQLGAVNYAEKASGGVQIGAINIIRENTWSDFPNGLGPGMIIFNWRF